MLKPHPSLKIIGFSQPNLIGSPYRQFSLDPAESHWNPSTGGQDIPQKQHSWIQQITLNWIRYKLTYNLCFA